jgi:hypothetical protein
MFTEHQTLQIIKNIFSINLAQTNQITKIFYSYVILKMVLKLRYNLRDIINNIVVWNKMQNWFKSPKTVFSINIFCLLVNYMFCFAMTKMKDILYTFAQNMIKQLMLYSIYSYVKLCGYIDSLIVCKFI